MFQSVSIRNFQSLKKIDLELGPLTVVVGDSSSGKSAMLRALRMLVCNERGIGFITHGESNSSVTVRDNNSVVTLEKGVSNSGEYRVYNGDSTTPSTTFTKLAGAVPEEVSKVLGLSPGGPNFAFQFDTPYLLKESGAAVATILGSLTGVSKIFEAVRESNRRRLAASTLLKTRTADFESVTSELKRFEFLEDERILLKEAQQKFDAVSALSERRGRLEGLVVSLDKAQKAFSELRVPNIPDLTKAQELGTRRRALAGILATVDENMTRYKNSLVAVEQHEAQQKLMEDQYHEELVKAGRCPTCQQNIEH